MDIVGILKNPVVMIIGMGIVVYFLFKYKGTK
jgi:Na+-transporting methylmalonyl-CoA/oxaloacetate decarboxylase gamma subunit